jgi:hypothetical protein
MPKKRLEGIMHDPGTLGHISAYNMDNTILLYNYGLTLTFFMPKKNNRSSKFGNSSPFPFPCLFSTSTIEIKNGEYTQVITNILGPANRHP